MPTIYISNMGHIETQKTLVDNASHLHIKHGSYWNKDWYTCWQCQPSTHQTWVILKQRLIHLLIMPAIYTSNTGHVEIKSDTLVDNANHLHIKHGSHWNQKNTCWQCQPSTHQTWVILKQRLIHFLTMPAIYTSNTGHVETNINTLVDNASHLHIKHGSYWNKDWYTCCQCQPSTHQTWVILKQRLIHLLSMPAIYTSNMGHIETKIDTFVDKASHLHIKHGSCWNKDWYTCWQCQPSTHQTRVMLKQRLIHLLTMPAIYTSKTGHVETKIDTFVDNASHLYIKPRSRWNKDWYTCWQCQPSTHQTWVILKQRVIHLGKWFSARGASVGRLQFVSTKFFCSWGEAQGNPFSEPHVNRMTVKPHFSETQNDRECGRLNCNILGELFNFDFF